jgi:hypothetical protein
MNNDERNTSMTYSIDQVVRIRWFCEGCRQKKSNQAHNESRNKERPLCRFGRPTKRVQEG